METISVLYKTLCTGASLYAPSSLLLISSKFWMGGGVGGGEARGPCWRGRVRGVEGANKRCGNEMALSARYHFTGPKKLEKSRAHPPPPSPRNGYARIQNIMHGAV
jgi:hypothetical protein